MPDETLRGVKTRIQFRKKPNSVTPDYRPSWKVPLLLLILHISSRGGKSSLTRLHVLNWATRTALHQQEFTQTVESSVPLFKFRVRFEPAFSRAIDLAAAAGFVKWVNGNRLELAPQGESIARDLVKQKEAFGPEITFLEGVGKRVTEDQALKLLKGTDIA